jgi:hypothetical protein
MRRPSLVCRRAVQSLQPPVAQHIWISDEQLSSTFQQFFRDTCPHQKRHGSHVPGPLEARRRSAKRRMTVSAGFYPQDSFPSSFNLGALFGFRNTQPAWKYEPPWLPKEAEPLDIGACRGASTGLQGLTIFSGDTAASIPKLDSPDLAKTRSPSKAPSSGPYSFVPNVAYGNTEQGKTSSNDLLEAARAEPIASAGALRNIKGKTEARACFQMFKMQIEGTAEYGQPEMDRALVKSFQQCKPSSASWRYNVMVLRHLRQLKWDPTAILEQHSASNLNLPPIYSPETLDLLSCLETFSLQYPHCIDSAHQLCVQLAESAQDADTSYTPYQDTVLYTIIRQIWHTAHLQGAHVEENVLQLTSLVAGKFWNQTSRQCLSSIALDLAQMDYHIAHMVGLVYENIGLIPSATQVLSCIPKERLHTLTSTITLSFAGKDKNKSEASRARSLGQMHIWLLMLQHLDAKGSFVDAAITSLANRAFATRRNLHARIPILLSALFTKASQTAAFEQKSMSKIHNLLASFNTGAEEKGPAALATLFGMLMSRVQAKGFPHEPLAGMVIDVLVRHAGLKAIPECLQVLDQLRLTLADATPLHNLVVKRVASIRNSSQSEKALQHTAFDLQACEKILQVLSRINSSTSAASQAELRTLQADRRFDNILTRARENHVLPLAFHDAAFSTDQRVHLIHQLAHQYTTDSTLSQREAWRAMYYLYKYLQQYALPIGPLFSKAVVRASIIRPLSENRFVSARRLIWVCHLVARIEGEDVAKRIEASFWHWRGDLIAHAKSVYVRVGGDQGGKAHVGTMKRLGLI